MNLNHLSLESEQESLIDQLCREKDIDLDSFTSGSKLARATQQGELEEFSTPPTTPKSHSQSPVMEPKLSSNLAAATNASNLIVAPNTYSSNHHRPLQLDNMFSNETDEHGLGPPPAAPPRRRDRRSNSNASALNISGASASSSSSGLLKASPPKPTTNGLPPTPQVYMGAGFSKIFNSCPLTINCCVSWVHLETRDEHLLLGCDEGIYTLNMNELHDACLDQLFPRKTVWMHVIGNTLMSVSGKTTHLYCHNVLQLHQRLHGNRRLSQTVDQVINRIPDKLVPWKTLSATTKIADTRGVSHVCVGQNKQNGYKYLCGATPAGVFLMQWYNPMNKFMLLKVFN